MSCADVVAVDLIHSLGRYERKERPSSCNAFLGSPENSKPPSLLSSSVATRDSAIACVVLQSIINQSTINLLLDDDFEGELLLESGGGATEMIGFGDERNSRVL